MRAADVVRTALSSLRGNRTRSFLTVLGLSIGVGACIAIGSLGIAAVQEVRGEMNRFGVDRIWVEAKAGNALPMDEDDVRALQAVGQAVAPVRYAALQAKNGTRAMACAVVATTADYAQIENLTLARGRFLRAEDEENVLRAAVLEDAVAEELFGSADCIGQKVTVGTTRYTVVGVLAANRSEYVVSDSKPKVYLPLSAYALAAGDEGMSEIIVRVGNKSVGAAAAEAKAALRPVHAAGDEFTVSSMAEQIESAERILRIVSTVLAVVGVICMLTGGVGVMNVLLTGVRERRGEIGIRKALGARDGEIFLQFVCEAACYGTLGALGGLALGFVLTDLGERVIGIAAFPVPWVVLCSVAFSCLVGAVCGVYPAMRAAAVSPVTAMRQM